MINNLRSKQTQDRYDYDKANGLIKCLWDEPSIYETEDFRIIKNSYPYDEIKEDCVMLLPKFSFIKAIIILLKNIKRIKLVVSMLLTTIWAEKNGYHNVMWNTPKAQSIPDITHIHILK
jgi:hypothetical protein